MPDGYNYPADIQRGRGRPGMSSRFRISAGASQTARRERRHLPKPRPESVRRGRFRHNSPAGSRPLL